MSTGSRDLGTVTPAEPWSPPACRAPEAQARATSSACQPARSTSRSIASRACSADRPRTAPRGSPARARPAARARRSAAPSRGSRARGRRRAGRPRPRRPRTPRRRRRSRARSRALRRRRADRRRRRRPACAEPHGRDREHARAAAEIEHRARVRRDRRGARGSRSSSRARPTERVALLDHDGERAIRRVLARRADPEAAADQHAVVILAPDAGAHVLDRLDAPRAEIGRQRQRRRRVGGDLEPAARIARLLDPAGEERAHALASASRHRGLPPPLTESRRRPGGASGCGPPPVISTRLPGAGVGGRHRDGRRCGSVRSCAGAGRRGRARCRARPRRRAW